MEAQLPRTLQEYLQKPHGSVPQLIRINATQTPRRLALTDAQQSLDYAALDALMDRVAFGLQRDGLRAGDVVALCAAPSAHYVAVLLGAVRAGMVVAPVSTQAMAELSDVLEAKAVFVDGPNRPSCAARPGIDIRSVALDGGPSGQSFNDWLPPTSGEAFEDASPDPQQPFFIICSSGTTGGAKGVVQSHDLRWKYVARASAFGYAPDATALIATPLHSNTTYASLLCTLTHGGHAIIQATFEPAEYLRLASEHRVTHTVLVPVMYEKILAHPAFKDADLSSFRMKLCTSAPFRASLKREVVARWPGDLIELYGMTEGGGNCLLQAHIDGQKLHTVGRPGPTSDIRIIDEAGHELPPGQRGEVVGHSPAMMSGYYRREDLTAACEWRDAGGKRFIRTGDIGQLDAQGYLTIFDRKLDLIERQGVRIYPSDIEDVLREHSDIADASVVGATDEQGEQVPVAFVCAHPGASADTTQILRWCNARLASYLWLSHVMAIDELPRSAIGKVLKRELRSKCQGLGASGTQPNRKQRVQPEL